MIPVDKMEWKDRLVQARLAKGLTQEQLAIKSNVTQQTIQKLENKGKKGSRASKHLPRICKELETTVEYILYGESVGVLKVTEEKNGNFITSEVVIKTIPVVSWESVGKHHLVNGKAVLEQADMLDHIPVPRDVGSNCLGLFYNGESMTPPSGSKSGFHDGDIIIYDVNRIPKDGDVVLAKGKDWPVATLMQYSLDVQGIYLLSLKQRPPLKLDDNIKICGVVSYVMSKR